VARHFAARAGMPVINDGLECGIVKDPKFSFFGGSVTRFKVVDWCFVHFDVACAPKLLYHGIVDWLEPISPHFHPVAHRIARNVDLEATTEDLSLTIQRELVAVFCGNDA